MYKHYTSQRHIIILHIHVQTNLAQKSCQNIDKTIGLFRG